MEDPGGRRRRGRFPIGSDRFFTGIESLRVREYAGCLVDDATCPLRSTGDDAANLAEVR
jgi:hypothetical protein